MLIDTDEFVILGLTVDGRPFRPADWAERLRRAVTVEAGGVDKPSEAYIRPIKLSNGSTALVVDARLAALDPRVYRFLRQFAKDNDLVVRPGRAFDRSSLPTGDA